MKKIFSIIGAGVFAAMLLSSCCSATHVVGISSNSAVGSKMGVSEQKTILGFFGKGGPEQSIKAAAANGGITKISHVEEYNKSIFFGVVVKHQIRVYGE
ncbi:MAG: hypothetical protein KBT39_11550 [Bacteroidales bacterium]|nr:hypothetical protein [Bacteroidales bacterium]